MTRAMAIAWLCAATIASCLVSASGLRVPADSNLLGDIASGTIAGYYSEIASSPVRAFEGIPYAAPPVGTLRFQAPQPALNFTGVLPTVVAGASCIQSCDLPSGLCPVSQSEDCLFANVFTPILTATPPSILLPVMLFIHGGGFTAGAGSSKIYDGSMLAAAGEVVVVTFNYRLGALGFFFQAESTPNAGIMDQQMAMEWVQANIAVFGGDPNLVTLFGQSAGATSVGIHLQIQQTMGGGSQLFQHAIMQSPPVGIPLRFPLEAELINGIFAGLLNCALADIACLQAAPVAAVLNATNVAGDNIVPDVAHLTERAQAWEPVVELLPYNKLVQPTVFFQTNEVGIPLMIGTTSQEAVVFIAQIWQVPQPISSLLVLGVETALFGLKSLAPLDALFPLEAGSGADGVNRDELSQLATAELFRCPVRNVTDAQRQRNSQIYMYEFDHVTEDSPVEWGPDYVACWTAVCHGAELAYVFSTATTASAATLTPDEVTLSSQMGAYWTNFAATGNPNVGRATPTDWLTVAETRNTLRFATGAGNVTIVENIKGDECDFLDTIGYMQ